MKWTIIAESGAKIEIDDESVSGINVTIGGTDYDISIVKG